MKKHYKAKQFLEEIRKTPVVSAVCKQLDISRQTISRWLKEDSEFKKEYEECMSHGIDNVNDLAISQVITKVKQGDAGLIKYWLSHNHKSFMKTPQNNLGCEHAFSSEFERRTDFLNVGESMLMKKMLDGDLSAIKFALEHNSGRYHPMKPEAPFLDMTDLSDPAVKNIIKAELDSFSERIQEINSRFLNNETNEQD